MSATIIRSASAAVLMLALFTSCSSTSGGGGAAYPEPQPAPEMALLEPLLGEWDGTAEFISVTDEMAAVLANEDGVLPTLKGESTAEWTLRGMFLLQYGWHDMGGGMKNNWRSYTRWDGEAGKFKSWYFSDMGESGESWMTWDPETKTFHVESRGTRMDGTTFEGSGTTVMQPDGTHTWTWSETSDKGPMEMRGTNHRS